MFTFLTNLFLTVCEVIRNTSSFSGYPIVYLNLLFLMVLSLKNIMFRPTDFTDFENSHIKLTFAPLVPSNRYTLLVFRRNLDGKSYWRR